MSKVTKHQAEKVLATVTTKYQTAEYPELDRPVLVDRDTHWEIVWESGPFEWALRHTMGGFDEEVFVLAQEFVSEEQARKAAIVSPAPEVTGTFVEPVTSYSIGVYPA